MANRTKYDEFLSVALHYAMFTLQFAGYSLEEKKGLSHSPDNWTSILNFPLFLMTLSAFDQHFLQAASISQVRRRFSSQSCSSWFDRIN